MLEFSSSDVIDRFFDAAWTGDCAIVADLVKEHPELVKATARNWPDEGKTALMMAAMGGNEACVKLLLAAGSDAKAENEASPTADTALMLAAAHGHSDCVKLLIPHSDLKATNNNGHTALDFAAAQGEVECVQLLFSAFAPANRDEQGRLALGSAQKKRHWNCVDVLGEVLSAEERVLLLSQAPEGALPRQLAVHERNTMEKTLDHKKESPQDVVPPKEARGPVSGGLVRARRM